MTSLGISNTAESVNRVPPSPPNTHTAYHEWNDRQLNSTEQAHEKCTDDDVVKLITTAQNDREESKVRRTVYGPVMRKWGPKSALP